MTYATKYSSTQEVAETVAAVFRENGLQAEVLPAREVRTLDGFNAVVLGAALYMGRWHANTRSSGEKSGDEQATCPRLPGGISA